MSRVDMNLCAVCGASVDEGYSAGGNMSVEECRYYCSDTCLNAQYTPEEWACIVALGEGEKYFLREG